MLRGIRNHDSIDEHAVRLIASHASVTLAYSCKDFQDVLLWLHQKQMALDRIADGLQCSNFCCRAQGHEVNSRRSHVGHKEKEP